jgi:hypothetical protein
MIENLKTMSSGNPFLMGFDNLIFEFDYFAAPETDQMIVVTAFSGGFIPGFPIVEFPLCGQTQTGEKLEGPIDRRITDLWIDPDHLGMDLRKVLMAGGVEEDIEDFCPLPGGLETLFGDQGLKLNGLHGFFLFEIEFQFHFKGGSLSLSILQVTLPINQTRFMTLPP